MRIYPSTCLRETSTVQRALRPLLFCLFTCLLAVAFSACEIISEPLPPLPDDNPLDPENPEYAAPTVTVTNLELDQILAMDSLDVLLEGNAEGMTFSYSLDGGEWTAYSPEALIALRYLNEGPHSLDILARYSTGDEMDAPLRIDFEVDAVKGPALWLRNKYVEVSPGEEFQVELILEETDNAAMLMNHIQFDADILTFVSMGSADYEGSQVISLNKMISDNTIEAYVASSLLNPAGESSHAVYSLTFRAKTAGQSTIRLLENELRTADNAMIPLQNSGICRVSCN